MTGRRDHVKRQLPLDHTGEYGEQFPKRRGGGAASPGRRQVPGRHGTRPPQGTYSSPPTLGSCLPASQTHSHQEQPSSSYTRNKGGGRLVWGERKQPVHVQRGKRSAPLGESNTAQNGWGCRRCEARNHILKGVGPQGVPRWLKFKPMTGC